MSILSLISSDNFIVVNKTLLKVLGIEATLLLGDLASQSNYWNENSILEDGFFYSTAENIEERTTLSVYKQQQAIQKLEKLGLLETKLKGVPAKKYFKILEQPICEFLDGQFVKNSQTSLLEINKQDCEKFKGKKNITKNKRENIDISIKENTKEKKSKSKDDDLIEQLDSYDLIQNYPELKEHFIEFIQARREQKEPLTPLALKKAINAVKGFFNGDVDKAIRSIDKSILCGYKGLFDPDDNDKFKSKHRVESNDYFGDELKRFNAEKSLSKNEGQIEISFTTPLAISSSNQSSGMTEEEQEAFLREYGI